MVAIIGRDCLLYGINQVPCSSFGNLNQFNKGCPNNHDQRCTTDAVHFNVIPKSPKSVKGHKV